MTFFDSFDDEDFALRWLQANGYSDACPLSLPSRPFPDIELADGRCGVEARRLEPLVDCVRRPPSEHTAVFKPLSDKLAHCLNALLDARSEGPSWSLSCEHRPPVPGRRSAAYRTLVDEFVRVLSPLAGSCSPEALTVLHRAHFDFDKHSGELPFVSGLHVCLDSGLCVECYPFHPTGDRLFEVHVSSSEGFPVASGAHDAIAHALEDKSSKRASHPGLPDYEQWWLVLVDFAVVLPPSQLSDGELDHLRRGHDFRFWDRALLLGALIPWSFDVRLPVPSLRSLSSC